MVMSEKIIYVMDTNFFFELIKSSEVLDASYSDILDDILTYLHDNDYFLYMTASVKKELEQQAEFRDFNKYLGDKRATDPRMNYKTLDKNPTIVQYQNILRPLFKGNENYITGLREAEQTDHEVIILAVLLAGQKPDYKIEIISNDHEVLDVSESLGVYLTDVKSLVLQRIHAYLGIHFLQSMRMSQSNYKTNIHTLHNEIFQSLRNLRKGQHKEHVLIDRLRLDQEYAISYYLQSFPEVQRLRSSNSELRKQIAIYKQTTETVKRQEFNQSNLLDILEELIEKILNDSITDDELFATLSDNKLEKFTDLLFVFGIITRDKDHLLIQRFFRSWGKVLNGAERSLALEIRNNLYQEVFKSLLASYEKLFKNNDIITSFNLYSQMLPLEIEMDWAEKEDKQLLEKFYVIGLYLCLIHDRFDEFKQIIEIIKFADQEDNLDNTVLRQFILLSDLLHDHTVSFDLSNVFKSNLLQNIELFYSARHWNAVWYLLLPVFAHLSDSERKMYGKFLENVYLITEQPPESLQEMWDNINTKYSIILGNNIGKSFSEYDIKAIKESNIIPDFLQGKHVVVDQNIGRAQVVIHVANRSRRLGIQILDKETDLENCLEIEFCQNSISSFSKCTNRYPGELNKKLSGIIVLKSKQAIETTLCKNELSDIRI